MKKIIQLNNAYISADNNGYMVKFVGVIPSYFSTLELCFHEYFDQTLKRNLIKDEKNTIEDALVIIRETKQEIEDVWRNSNKANLSLPKP